MKQWLRNLWHAVTCGGALTEDAATLRELADEMPHYKDYVTLNAIADRLAPRPNGAA
jgi:hypothetical protein